MQQLNWIIVALYGWQVGNEAVQTNKKKKTKEGDQKGYRAVVLPFSWCKFYVIS